MTICSTSPRASLLHHQIILPEGKSCSFAYCNAVQINVRVSIMPSPPAWTTSVGISTPIDFPICSVLCALTELLPHLLVE